MTEPLRSLRISFGDDQLLIPIQEQGDPSFLSIGGDHPVVLPGGEQIEVYAEVGLDRPVADVCVSVVEAGRVTAVRASVGVALSYTTRGGEEVLLEVGTGAWEE